MELKVKVKFVTSSKVKIFQNPSSHILEKLHKNYAKKSNFLESNSYRYFKPILFKRNFSLKNCSATVAKQIKAPLFSRSKEVTVVVQTLSLLKFVIYYYSENFIMD